MKIEAAQFEIKKSYLFSSLDEAEIHELGKIAQLEVLNPGDMLVSQGDSAKNLYFVHYGSVRIDLRGHEGEVEISRVAGTGATLCEAAIVSDVPRLAGAQAIERTEVVKIPIEKLKVFLHHHPAAATRVYRALAEHFASSLSHLAKQLVKMRESHHLEKHGLTAL